MRLPTPMQLYSVVIMQRGNRFRDRSPQSDRCNHQPGRPAVAAAPAKTDRTELTVDIAIHCI